MSEGLALKVTGIDVHYKDFQALWNVSLETKEGEITSVIGANGSGKSTLLNTVSGILEPSRDHRAFPERESTDFLPMRQLPAACLWSRREDGSFPG